MYIISKYKDYYDGVVGSVGIDKTIVYQRTFRGIKNSDDYPKPFKFERRGWNDSNPFTSINFQTAKDNKYERNSPFIVGFCGKLYLGWRFFYTVKTYGEFSDEVKHDIVYGYDKAKKFLKEGRWDNKNEERVKQVMDYDPIDIFREIKAPIFVFNDSRKDLDLYYDERDCLFAVNPILKEYSFAKAVDPFTAFTELQMFISGVLGVGEKEIIEVADKYKIGQHGFNKWSFRREGKNSK